MKTLRRLSAAALVVALGTVMLGSWTRINGAGMTCPDWPLCHGKLIPSFADGTIWEWTHRLFAFFVAPLVLAVMIAAWRVRSRSRFVIPLLSVIGLLFVLQCLLGLATVQLENSPFSVVIHWGTAMAFVASLCAMLVFAGTRDEVGKRYPALQTDQAVGGALILTTLVAFATMCAGAYVSSSGAGLACLSLPGCAGNVVVYNDGQLVQMLHRSLAAATLLCAVSSFTIAWVRRASPRVRFSVAVALAFLFVQVILGLLNVALRLPMDLREAHAINAAFLFLAFVAATLFAIFESNSVPATSTVA
jgi:heme A synthase